jgi:hypothetical protein
MAAGVPPPPLNSPSGSYYWLEWYTNLTNFLNGTNIPWSNLNFTSSNLTDIQTRNHNDLQNIQGGPINNHWHLAARGYIDSTGVGTGFPAGWSVSRTSAGIYNITTDITTVAPLLMATGTSHTVGVVVQWIQVTTANHVIVYLTSPAGAAADGNCTVAVYV